MKKSHLAEGDYDVMSAVPNECLYPPGIRDSTSTLVCKSPFLT